MTTAGPVRLGIIGHGVQGSAYGRMIAEGEIDGMVIGALCDVDESKREDATAYGVPFYEDYREMIAGGDVDAVVTTLPHFAHADAGIAALSAGVHALVEKPASLYTAQVRELNAAAEARGDLTFAIMFNQRTNPLYRRIKEIVDAGEIGAIRRSSWTITTWWRPQSYYDQSAWRATWGGEGGGVLVNQSPHQLDLWQWICGTPRTVFAKLAFGFRRDIVVEDEATILADFGDGVTGTFVTATHDLVGTDRFEILGDRGKIVVEGSREATVTRLDEPEQDISARVDAQEAAALMAGRQAGVSWSTETIDATSHWGGQHREVLRNFAANILHGEPLIAPGADGIHGVRLANAAHLSAWLGQEVPVDLDDEAYLRELNARIRTEGLYRERE